MSTTRTVYIVFVSLFSLIIMWRGGFLSGIVFAVIMSLLGLVLQFLLGSKTKNIFLPQPNVITVQAVPNHMGGQQQIAQQQIAQQQMINQQQYLVAQQQNMVAQQNMQNVQTQINQLSELVSTSGQPQTGNKSPEQIAQLATKARNLESARDFQAAALAYQDAGMYSDAGRIREQYLEKQGSQIVNIERIGDTVLNDSVMMGNED